jgi:hypothetical protein
VRRIAVAASVAMLSAVSLPALGQASSQDVSSPQPQNSSLQQNSDTPQNSSTSQDSSSLSDLPFQIADLSASSLAPAPAPQYGENYPRRGRPYPASSNGWSRFSLEAGGGFTAPLGNSQADLTYGWNFRGGVGYKFTRDVGLMAEYEFDRNKIPGATLSQVGIPGGNVHIWSLTLDPILWYKTTGGWGGYVTGGGGFYRRLTSFTEPALAFGEYCDFFFCYPYQFVTQVTVSHFSSNQGGANIGTGLTFGGFGGAKFYSEARYEWLNTPGRGTQIIPVTFGLRW